MPARAPDGGPTTVAEWVEDTRRRFEAAGLHYGHGTDNALDEAAWAVLAAAGLPVDDLGGHATRRLQQRQQQAVRALVRARIRTRKPIAYLTGEAWFAGLPFTVDERVIVPRSYFGELLPGGFAPWITPARVTRILDLCTGSGCIAIALAQRFPDAVVDAVDLSEDALAVAAINVERHGLGSRVRPMHGDLFSGLADRHYDLIASNPPYVRDDVMRGLPAEYRREPALALAGGGDGCALAAKILRQAADHLAPEGLLAMEVGANRRTMMRRFPGLRAHWPRMADGETPVLIVAREALAAAIRGPLREDR